MQRSLRVTLAKFILLNYNTEVFLQLSQLITNPSNQSTKDNISKH